MIWLWCWLVLSPALATEVDDARGQAALALMRSTTLDGRLSALASLPPSQAVDEGFVLLEALVAAGRTSPEQVRGFGAWWAEGTPIDSVVRAIETGEQPPGITVAREGDDALLGFEERRQRFTLLELQPIEAPQLTLQTAPSAVTECPMTIDLSPAGELENARTVGCPAPWSEEVPEAVTTWVWPSPKIDGAAVPATLTFTLLLTPDGVGRLPALPKGTAAALPWLSAPERAAAELSWTEGEARIEGQPGGGWEVVDGLGRPIDGAHFAAQVGDERRARRAATLARLDELGTWGFVAGGALVALSAIIPIASLEGAEEPVAQRYEVNEAQYETEQDYLEAVSNAQAALRDDTGAWRSATARDETRLVTGGVLFVSGSIIASMAPAHVKAAATRTPTTSSIYTRKQAEELLPAYNARLRQELGLPPDLDLGRLPPVHRRAEPALRWALAPGGLRGTF